VTYTRVEIDGEPPTTDRLAAAALVNYGHYSTMQIRRRAVRGLDLHFARLDSATRELFDVTLDPDRVRALLRHCLGDDYTDATGRVTVFDAGSGAPSVMVALGDPADVLDRPARLQTVRYQRPLPHLKHVGSFGQIYYGLRAERAGYDDALLSTTTVSSRRRPSPTSPSSTARTLSGPTRRRSRESRCSSWSRGCRHAEARCG
jgi:branched-subunit amino acid aminotransferase/4-amino-4-deoxychorismate lyase